MNAENPLVVIGMDPHKRTVTIEVMTSHEQVVGGGRFTTDADGYAQLLGYARQWPQRLWAVEGCAGIGKHVASRLVADGEDVVDVPAKMSARVRVFATGQGRKTDATDAHSIALVGVRMGGLRPVFAVYSTFLSRAFDQVNLDVGLHRQPVVFCLDRAGITGNDGPSHHGVLDLVLFTKVPNMTVLAPSSYEEVGQMLHDALDITDGPVLIRWPKVLPSCPSEDEIGAYLDMAQRR